MSPLMTHLASPLEQALALVLTSQTGAQAPRRSLTELLLDWAPTAGTVVVMALVLTGVNRWLRRAERTTVEHQLRDQLIMIGLNLVALLAVIVSLPIHDSSRTDLLHLLGVVLSAAIALSSTTFLSNAMGAVMLRTVGNFKLGDFLQVSEHFGRVTERGLFHTEIQTEERDLLTLPNMFLITNPVRVMRSTGTIVSCTVSLGYDVSRKRIEPLMLTAAEQVGLSDPFVQVIELGDFSVSYRIAGLLSELKQLISQRSNLRKAVMDSLHEGGVEIVSPTFMNTRAFNPSDGFIPRSVLAQPTKAAEKAPEDMIFDKADEAETLEKSRRRLADLDERIKALRSTASEGGDGAKRAKQQAQRLELRRSNLDEEIKLLVAQLEEADH